jgi:hypothetical protein
LPRVGDGIDLLDRVREIAARVPIGGHTPPHEILVGPNGDGRQLEARSIDAAATVAMLFRPSSTPGELIALRRR